MSTMSVMEPFADGEAIYCVQCGDPVDPEDGASGGADLCQECAYLAGLEG